MAQQKVRDCIGRARASASRKVDHFVLFHLVDSGDGLQPVRLQEWFNGEEKVAEQIETYAVEHAQEYRIAQQYKIGAFEVDIDDSHPFASVTFKVGAGNEVNGETTPPNERGMLRQNMAHTEFAIRWGAERCERSATTVERVLTTALTREQLESGRWMTRAIAAENKLDEYMKVSAAERAAQAKHELDRLDTQHKVATRQRLADEALKMLPIVTNGFSAYVRNKFAAQQPAKSLPQRTQTESTAPADGHADEPATNASSDTSLSRKDAKILTAVARLCDGLTKEEMVGIRLAVTEETWVQLEVIFDAIQGE